MTPSQYASCPKSPQGQVLDTPVAESPLRPPPLSNPKLTQHAYPDLYILSHRTSTQALGCIFPSPPVSWPTQLLPCVALHSVLCLFLGPVSRNFFLHDNHCHVCVSCHTCLKQIPGMFLEHNFVQQKCN